MRITLKHTWAVLSLLSLCLAGCGGGGSEEPSLEELVARERVAHWFEGQNLERARAELAPLVSGPDAQAQDLLRAAAIEFAASEPAAANAFLDRAEALDPDSAAVHFLRGQLAREEGELELALTELSAALALAPADLPTRYTRASTLQDLDRFEEAEAELREVLASGIENGGSWYVSALYRLERLLLLAGRDEEALPIRERREELEAQGVRAPSTSVTRAGNLGKVLPPAPIGNVVPPPPGELMYGVGEVALPTLSGATGLSASDVDGDGVMDLVAWSAGEVQVALRRGDGWEDLVVGESGADFVRSLDLDNAVDGQLELLVARGGALSFWQLDAGEWRQLEVATPVLPSAALDVTAVDFDHEGDLDLLLVGEFGARLWRNDGAASPDPEARGAFVDASALAELPSDVSYSWCTVEDFDNDSDVDLLFGGPGAAYLADSLRAGRFADQSARLKGVLGLSIEPLVEDFDGDGRPDLWPLGEGATWWRQRDDLGFSARPCGVEVPVGALTGDLDLDGAVDLFLAGRAVLAAGLEQQRLTELKGPQPAKATPHALLDVDGDRRLDLAFAEAGGVRVHRAQGEPGRAISVSLRGNRTNRRAVGSLLELRAGAVYRRVYYRGEPVLLGSGGRERLDVLRITYPNGLVQSELDVDLTDQTIVDDPDSAFGLYSEPEGLIGSCPFLYTWNGETFEFVTDVLGITPLGLPIAPGMFVPPDHDEYVLVSGEQLRERDGELVMQLTEELREVTYLDRVRLDVVDHPAEAEVFPNELFCFPPFPEAHTHTLRAPLAPVRATGSDGRDWTAAVTERDDVHAVPFERQPPQFQGLAKPWFLEVEFDPAEVRDAELLRLALTGWFFWSDASANMAAAGQPGVDFVPPIFQVPDGQGGWRDAGPPVGFPAGKTKTMVIDVSEVLDREDPRLRIFCTLQLFWDRIALATCDDDAPLEVTSLEAQSAELWLRGFSAPLSTGREDLPERFDWDVLSEEPRWNQHPGRYTRLGDCRALLGEVDDRYAILGSGDALELRFDARGLPALKDGWRRDYLLYLDGWAKDRDPNTIDALEVTPLPFHAMSGYPYGADEAFPDDELHRAWDREWNTRPGHDWIVPLSERPPTLR